MQTLHPSCIHILCHQKYFTLQFRPSPSEIVVVTRRTSPLTIQCMIPNPRWNIHNLTSSILCRFNFLMLGCYLILICLQRPPGHFGYTSPQWDPSPDVSPCRWYYTTSCTITYWFHTTISVLTCCFHTQVLKKYLYSDLSPSPLLLWYLLHYCPLRTSPLSLHTLFLRWASWIYPTNKFQVLNNTLILISNLPGYSLSSSINSKLN